MLTDKLLKWCVKHMDVPKEHKTLKEWIESPMALDEIPPVFYIPPLQKVRYLKIKPLRKDLKFAYRIKLPKYMQIPVPRSQWIPPKGSIWDAHLPR